MLKTARAARVCPATLVLSYLTIQTDEEFGLRVIRNLEAKNGLGIAALTHDMTSRDIGKRETLPQWGSSDVLGGKA
jgi:hypothetical protein